MGVSKVVENANHDPEYLHYLELTLEQVELESG